MSLSKKLTPFLVSSLILGGCMEAVTEASITPTPQAILLPEQYQDLCLLENVTSEILPDFTAVGKNCAIAILPNFPTRLIFPSATTQVTLCYFNESDWQCVAGDPGATIVGEGYLVNIREGFRGFLAVYGNDNIDTNTLDLLNGVYAEYLVVTMIEPYINGSLNREEA